MFGQAHAITSQQAWPQLPQREVVNLGLLRKRLKRFPVPASREVDNVLVGEVLLQFFEVVLVCSLEDSRTPKPQDEPHPFLNVKGCTRVEVEVERLELSAGRGDGGKQLGQELGRDGAASYGEGSEGIQCSGAEGVEKM